MPILPVLGLRHEFHTSSLLQDNTLDSLQFQLRLSISLNFRVERPRQNHNSGRDGIF